MQGLLVTIKFLGCGVLSVLGTIPVVAADWPMLGRDATRSGSTTDEIRPPFDRKWYRLFPDEGIQSGVQPIVAGSTVYLGTLAGRLHAMDADTGHDRWTYQAGGPILHAAAASDGQVVFGAADGAIHALNTVDGSLGWRFATGAAVWNAPAIHHDVVFVGSRDGWLYALDLDNGRLRWKANTGAPLLNSPAVDARSGCVYIGSEAMRVHAFALEDGRERWRSDRLPGASMRGYHPVIAPDGSVLVTTQPVIGYDRFQNLLLDMVKAVFVMDQTRTYGWHDSLLLVHDEQSQLSLAGRVLLNTHQNDVNAMDLDTLKGYTEPFARNIHEPAKGEALALRLAALRGEVLPPGKEWLARGTAVYGGGSVLDVPVTVADDSFYYLPTHELNAGCALIAYRSRSGAPGKARPPAGRGADRFDPSLETPRPDPSSVAELEQLPWDWDTLATPRLKNFLEALPAPIPGTITAPLTEAAAQTVAAIPDAALDEFIWTPAADLNALTPALSRPTGEGARTLTPSLSHRMGEGARRAGEGAAPSDAPRPQSNPSHHPPLAARLDNAVRELISQPWRPLVLPAAKAPDESYRLFLDPSETLYTLLLARPLLDPELRRQTDTYLDQLVHTRLDSKYAPAAGASRVPYDVPLDLMRIVEDTVRDPLAQLYPLWLWSQTPPARAWLESHWSTLRPRLRTPPPKTDDDCGNGRLAGLIAYCRLGRQAGDDAAAAEALPITRQAMRTRLIYEFAHPRGGVLRVIPNGRSVFARWRCLTPDVARFIAAYARPIQQRLVTAYVDRQRPCWWLAWNIEQSWRNEAPMQLPTASLEIFTVRALLLGESADQLETWLDLPWCQGDEFYVQKLALTLRAMHRDRRESP